MPKRIAALALTLAATSGLAGPAAAETVKIGYTATLTGDFAAFGVNMRRGLELALERLNAAGPVTYEMTVADDRGEPKEGALIAQKFCSDDEIDVVMGYSFSSVALAAVPIYDGCGLPVVGSAVTSPDLSGSSPYFRRNVLTDAVQGAMMGTHAVKDLGKQKIYVLYQQDDYGIGVANAFKAAAEAAGGTIVGEDAYLLGTKDFKTQLAKVREAAPDAIFIGGFYAEAAKIAEQGQGLGLTASLLGTDGSLNPELIQLGGKAVEGMRVYGMFDPSVTTPTTEPFIKAYQAKHGEAPSAWAALAYDAALTLAAAVEAAQAGGTVDRESINEAFGSVRIEGVTGVTAFDDKGDREGSIYFLDVKDGRFQLAD